jgi:hypothetical protein
MVLSKHTIGCFLVIATFVSLYLYNKKQEKKIIVKNYLVMICIGLLSLISFIIYLIVYDSYKSFIDLAFCINNFSNNSIIDIKVIFIGIIIFLTLLIFYKKRRFKFFSKDNIVILIFFVFSLFFLYPIVDLTHFLGPLIIATLFFYTNKFKMDIKNYINILAIIIILFISIFYINIVELKECKISKYKNYSNHIIYNQTEDRIDDLKQIIEKYNNVYLIDKYTTLYENALNRNMGYYDILNNGNTGSKTSLEVIKELIYNNNGYIVIDKNEKFEYQWDNNINIFIKENLKYIETIGEWAIYKF